MTSTLKLILIRGLPGSGKSTLAKKYQMNHYEADMYFVNEQGKYIFDASKLKQAHAWCQYKVGQSLSLGQSAVVSNTFVRLWEIKPYQKMAQKYGAKFEIIECHATYANTHGVPQESIDRMKSRWQSMKY
ncbi:ATP-binding protein [Vibrio marisflavi]|uniref:AAA family ATPase n=1 Tax=Vibrio marisflavi CECT 7928 TaxID=634439 RepID=A0ABM9A4Q9_9VIBR|nr:ATP-binding protein [Vibrio marisflavi]CAH0539698.1 hypothetical protein VMF7928_02375 [Vibrio marisflavi CECT 7928]